MSDKQQLGEFKTVDNEAIDNNLQSKTLTVGHIRLDGKVIALAFTGKELNRPEKRAEDNKEDLPGLLLEGPTAEEHTKVKDTLKASRVSLKHAKAKHETTKEELEAVKEELDKLKEKSTKDQSDAKDKLKSANDTSAKALERNAKTQRELDFYKSRGLFARLFNVQYCEDCEGTCENHNTKPKETS